MAAVNRANGRSTLCDGCISVFQTRRQGEEPGFLTRQSVPTVETTAAHHDSEQSFPDAVQRGCFICRRVDVGLPKATTTTTTTTTTHGGVLVMTRASVTKTGRGEYIVAIYIATSGAGGRLGRVTHFTAAQVPDSMSMNIPASRHTELIQKWVSECRSGTGSHATCRDSRAAVQRAVQLAGRARRFIQLTTDKKSNEVLFRLQDLEAANNASFTHVPYATMSERRRIQVAHCGTHTLDTKALLTRFLSPKIPVAQGYASQAEQLAALCTSVAMAYSQTQADEKKPLYNNHAILDQTDDLVGRLALNSAMMTYACGTWSDGMIHQLAWHGDTLRQEQLPGGRRRTTSHSLPTWSWTSFHGPIVFEFLLSSGAATPCLEPGRAYAAPVTTTELEPGDGHGDDNARIRARGSLLEVAMDRYDDSTSELKLAGSPGDAAVQFDCEEEEEMVLESRPDGPRQVAGKEARYMAWPLFAQVDKAGRVEARGLLLREVGTTDRRGTYDDNAQGPVAQFVRCAWLRYSGTDNQGRGEDVLLALARGDKIMQKEFLIM